MEIENFKKAEKIIQQLDFLEKSTKKIELAAYGGFTPKDINISFNTNGTSQPEYDVLTEIPKNYYREFMELIDKIHQAQIKELKQELKKL